jgi:hypothetical protein
MDQFGFDWLVQSDTAIYCVVIAGVWQSAGFAMALFLAGLRGIDDSIIKAAQMDGASLPRIYWRIILPVLRPVVFSTILVLSHLSIKAFDLVMALTAGGPGYASDVPATFMFTMSFHPWPDWPGGSQCHHDAGVCGGLGGAVSVQRTARQAARALSTRKHIHERQNTLPRRRLRRAVDRRLLFPGAAVRDAGHQLQGCRANPLGQPAEPAHLAQL